MTNTLREGFDATLAATGNVYTADEIDVNWRAFITGAVAFFEVINDADATMREKIDLDLVVGVATYVTPQIKELMGEFADQGELIAMAVAGAMAFGNLGQSGGMPAVEAAAEEINGVFPGVVTRVALH